MYNSPRRNPRTQNIFPWTWVIVVSGVIVILLLAKWFMSWSKEANASAYLTVTPREQSTVYISMSASSKNRIDWVEKLFASDKSLSVETGWASAENEYMKVDLDKNTELTYKSHSSSGEVIGVSKGRAWIAAKNIPVTVELKNFSLIINPGNVSLVEQNNAFSVDYAIQGISSISTSIGSYALQTGNRIMIGKSDLVSGSTNLSSLAGPIDESIMQNELFTRNNWENLLKQVSSFSWTNQTTSGSITNETGVLSNTTTNHVIEITDPIDGTIAKTNTITIIGNILSKDVKRVTIDDKDASVSPVNETFVMQNLSMDKDIMNFVYKAYDGNNSLMEKWVLVVFSSRWVKDNQWRLVSNNFPISNKDFKIVFPTENPYKTTDSLVKVQWTVPRDTVEYIVVNGYRLQKFIPNSTVWYYYANTDTKSMVDGINLYTIKFYGSDNTVLYSQLFTIVKELKNVNISGEIIK